MDSIMQVATNFDPGTGWDFTCIYTGALEVKAEFLQGRPMNIPSLEKPSWLRPHLPNNSDICPAVLMSINVC